MKKKEQQTEELEPKELKTEESEETSEEQEKDYFEGIITLEKENLSKVWTIPYDKSVKYIKVKKEITDHYNIQDGMRIKCEIIDYRAQDIVEICGIPVDEYEDGKIRKTAINPREKFDFGDSEFDSLRILDMFAPIAKGTRGLIVSPPKAGKTTLLEQLTIEINRKNPDLRTIVLLIDERPEEITEFKQKTDAIIFHSSMDRSNQSHIDLGMLMLRHISHEINAGNDIVVLLDSLTRLGRSFNRDDHFSGGKILSGGLGSDALMIPRRIFGLGRNILEGGSCTILATILQETGSRMDDVIFHEFKGTGNCDIILDREIANDRVYPAIDIVLSATRKDEKILTPEHLDKINRLRRELIKLDKASAVTYLKKLFRQFDSNEILLDQIFGMEEE